MSSTPQAPKINWLACMGDSITNADNMSTLKIAKSQEYPYLVKQMIGGNCRERNLGVGGVTTANMLSRMWDMLRFPPTVATIYGGINDANPVNTTQAGNSNDPTLVPTLSLSVNVSSALTSGVTHYVTYTWMRGASESNSSPEASILVPLGNQLVITLPTFPSGVTSANIYISTSTGTETKQGNTTTTTYAQSVALVAGVAQPKGTMQSNILNMVNLLKNAGCNRIILCNIHTIPGTSGTSDTTYDPYRAVLQSIATSNNLPFCDFHTVSLINPTDYNQSADYLHLSASGQQKIANLLKAAIDAQGWTTVLQN